jgi:2,4-dienoyl-CoA reductase (NADPH2)
MSESKMFQHLAEPIQIGKLRLKNRMIKNGNSFFWEDPADGGFMNDKYIGFFEALAKGGVALASTTTSPLQDGPLPGFKTHSDEFIPGWQKFTDTLHRHDCLAFHQLFHLGGMSPLFFKAPPGVASSSIPKEVSPRPLFEVAREMTIPEIDDVVERFASSAERLKRAGFDGTEINGACNHLLNSFLSRAWNKRTDEYGPQSLENRLRIYVQVIKAIKAACGDDWPIIALMNGMEPSLEEGLRIEETREIAAALVEAGADAIEIRVEHYTWVNDWKRRDSTHFPDIYYYPEPPKQVDPLLYKKEWGRGGNILIAAEIKKAVSVPVIVNGKMDWEIGNRAIGEGKIDVIAMTRRLIADPAAPGKALAGNLEDIRPCTSCMTCFDRGEHFQPVVCRVNASLGREKEYEIKPAATQKKVMIIGGGPSGMEAARVAAMRGHDVTLYAKEKKLGGSMPVASMVKGFEREDIMGFSNYLATQVKKLGVKVKNSSEATAETVGKEKPDVLILAAGGTHNIPDIPGIDKKMVLTGEELHGRLKKFLKFTDPATMRKLSNLWLPSIGKNVVIIGGRLHGCQTAEFLVHRGRNVTIVDDGAREEIGDGLLEVFLKPYLFHWLEDHNVEILSEVKYEEVTKNGLVVTTKDGERKTLAADSVITALPLKSNTEMAKSMAGMAQEVHVIGDADKPALIFDAVADGARIAREI